LKLLNYFIIFIMKPGTVLLREGQFRRTGSKIYGIRNRTPDSAANVKKGLRNISELSAKTRGISLRLDRQESADPLIDDGTKSFEVASD
jgi:hypothetical protein